jgi:thiol-disulfide isomerase/thioredoxin
MSTVTPGPGPGLPARLGLVVTQPRWALAVAADRRNGGRAGSDLLVALLLVVVAAHLRALVGAAWIGAAVQLGLGVHALAQVAASAATIALVFLAVGSAALFALGGPRRELARAIDLASVAVLPLLYVELGATVVARGLDLAVPRVASLALSAVSYAWAGGMLALAARPARLGATVAAVPPAATVTAARRAGWLIVAIAAVGLAVQGRWILGNLDLIRPMTEGDAAPAIALPRIEAGGALGAPVSLPAGRVTVVEFWATWCGPCLASLPRLDAMARQHAADVTFLAVNLDDAVKARALFDRAGYQLTLLRGDDATADRYGVTAIPHAVVIGRGGAVVGVAREGPADVEALVRAALGDLPK